METEIKNLVITGGGGFIGSHFIEYFLEETPFRIVNIDSFWHKGQYTRLDELKSMDTDRFVSFHHNLTAPIDDNLSRKIRHWFGSHSPSLQVDYLINLASNSAVERSIKDPLECWKNNCDLIVNVLEYARQCSYNKAFRLLHVSTDEVYGDYADDSPDGKGKGHKEWSVIKPSNPYAASKAAQEALCIAYRRSYGTNIIIANTMNNIGERQDTEKFVPKIISKIMQDEKIPVYVSNGKPGSRVYLDARVHAQAAHFLLNVPMVEFSRGPIPRVNVCGKDELNNQQIVELIAKIIGKKAGIEYVESGSARPGYDQRYLLDPYLMNYLGFKPSCDIVETLARIVKHAIKSPWWLEVSTGK